MLLHKMCVSTCAGTAPPPDDAFMRKYNSPSEYSKRYTLSGEAKLMLQLLGTGILPDDFWAWYLKKAGRSELTNSFATYVAATLQHIWRPAAVHQGCWQGNGHCDVSEEHAQLVG